MKQLKNIKRSMLLFIMLMISSLWISSQTVSTISNSQTQYPKKSIINSDTVFVISKPQFLKVNLMFVKFDELVELNENYKIQGDLYDLEIEKLEKSDSVLNNTINLKDKIITNKDSIVLKKDEIIIIKDDEIKIAKRQRNIAGGVGAALLILLILL